MLPGKRYLKTNKQIGKEAKRIFQAENGVCKIWENITGVSTMLLGGAWDWIVTEVQRRWKSLVREISNNEFMTPSEERA